MANPLQQTGELTDDLLLGHISWYTVTKPRITHKEFAKLVTDLGLSKTIIPKPPRPGDAFKRACRYSERTNIPILGTENYANILIRSVAQNSEEIERHMILEERDPQNRKLGHTDVAHLRFERQGDKGKLHVKRQSVESDALTEIVDESLRIFIANIEEATQYIDAQVIRRMIREQLDIANAIAVRSKGSVYFVPKSSRDIVEKLEQFCQSLNSGSEFFAVPMPDTGKYRDFITNAFTAEVHKEAVQLITELQEKLAGDKQMTAKAYADYRKRYNILKQRASDYGSLVEQQMDEADIEIQALKVNLKALLMEDKVKA